MTLKIEPQWSQVDTSQILAMVTIYTNLKAIGGILWTLLWTRDGHRLWRKTKVTLTTNPNSIFPEYRPQLLQVYFLQHQLGKLIRVWIIQLVTQVRLHLRLRCYRGWVRHCKEASKYCNTRKFSWDKFSPISPSERFRSFNCHYSMAVLFYIITKAKILEAFNFHGFASSAKRVKINRRWNFLLLQY